MSIKVFQRARIGAALRSILQAATGRTPSRDEVAGRVAAYLSRPSPRGLGPGDQSPSALPLFHAADYTPLSESDPLGGADGRDISRGWAAFVEDCDTVDEALTEFERRLASARSLIRKQGTALSSDADALALAALALKSQVRTAFFGGTGGAGAAGRGRSVWSNPASQGLQTDLSTALLLSSGIGVLPTQGQAKGEGGGGALSDPTLLASSDTSLFLSLDARAFLEQPMSEGQAWSFKSSDLTPASLTFKLGGPTPVGALEIEASPGVTVAGIMHDAQIVPFEVLRTAGTLWVIPSLPLPVGTALTLMLNASASGTRKGIAVGSVSSVKAHIFSFNSTGTLVWGPFEVPDSGLFCVSLDSLTSATPKGASVEMQVSVVSPEGPWTNFPETGTPLTLSGSGSSSVDLLASSALPDPLSQGFYQFPFTQADSLVGATLTAGTGQAKVEAYFFKWSSVGEVAHDVKPSDWSTPQGTPHTVAMGAGPTFRGDVLVQSFPKTAYSDAGTCLGRYRDKRGVEATFIALRNNANEFILQPGYNYRFSFGLYSVGNSFLADVPIGIFNPNGDPGLYALPLLVELNGQQVYRTAQTFKDFNEMSSAPNDYGDSPSDYTAGTGSRSYQGKGASWPPHCGRMKLALSPGWNTLSISLYVPVGDSFIDANLSYNAGIVFGPCLFNDKASLYNATGIENVRGWTAPWMQLSEFDLRTNTPLGLTNVWAWVVDPSTRTLRAILLNHNPGYSETGYPTLDGVLTGQPRTHQITYLPAPSQTASSVPGQDPDKKRIWVQAQLSSSTPECGPFVSAFTLSVN